MASSAAIHHTGKSVFRGLNNDFLATRYHSLTIDPPSACRRCWKSPPPSDDGVIQGVMHKTHPVHGVQFHPESIASENGHALLNNFLHHRARLRQRTGMKVTVASVDFPPRWHGARRRAAGRGQKPDGCSTRIFDRPG